MSPSPLTPACHRRLVSQLDSARRAVGAARLAGDPAAEATAHAEMHMVKLALGESAESWWESA